jgi:rubrerythrin
MPQFNSVDEILQFAIEREEEAALFYLEQSSKVKSSDMRRAFEEFAKEEKSHKAKLVAIRAGKTLMPPHKKVLDLKMAEMHDPVTPTATMDYADVLVLAMQREKASFKLYTDLAALTEDENTRHVFQSLAQEEAKHKLRFELEYDREVLGEN